MIYITFLLSMLIIVSFSIYKVQKKHDNFVLQVSEKRITEAAMSCYYEEKCFENKVTLGELIFMGYLKEEVNPKTKMYYSHESYVEKKENTYTFVEVLS